MHLAHLTRATLLRALRPTRACVKVSVVRARQWPAGRARLHSWVGRQMVDEAEGVTV